MYGEFNSVKPLHYYVQKVLPLVYDDSLSYYEVLNKVVKKLNELVANNEKIPQYIADLIENYITSGKIGEVVQNVLTNYMLNVKNPPNNIKGAVGDGSADDTMAIQACIDYAYENGGKAVYFPSGVYLTQPLKMKDGVSLFGFDPNTTRLVLRGGATEPLLNMDSVGNTIKGLTFDGNADIQVNNLDLIVANGGKYIFDDLILKDGYCLLKLALNESCFISNIVFDKCVQDSMIVTGKGIFIGDNLIFNDISVLNGRSLITLNVDNSTLTNIHSIATIDTAFIINSNNNIITAQVRNERRAYVDNGDNNNINIIGKLSAEKMSSIKAIKAEEFILDIKNPITYKEPQFENEYFSYVPFKYGNMIYKVLVLGGADLKKTIDDIRIAISQAIIDMGNRLDLVTEELTNKIETERTERVDEDERINVRIETEKTVRANEDEKINARIDKIGYVYLQQEEPTITNNNTIWYDVNGVLNCGDGVSIGNAETSESAPESPYWFDPIESEEM